MILDLEGPGTTIQGRFSPVLSTPSVLEQAFANQRPSTALDLLLPSDLAVEVSPLNVDGIYGPRRPVPTVRLFRIREGHDL